MFSKARSPRRNRKGSALLLCTLAAAMLSMAAVGIIRGSRRAIARTDSLNASTEGRLVADGLFQRAIAHMRNDPAPNIVLTDSNSPLPSATCQLRTLSPTAVEVTVFLYAGATVPARQTIVDPTTL